MASTAKLSTRNSFCRTPTVFDTACRVSQKNDHSTMPGVIDQAYVLRCCEHVGGPIADAARARHDFRSDQVNRVHGFFAEIVGDREVENAGAKVAVNAFDLLDNGIGTAQQD